METLVIIFLISFISAVASSFVSGAFSILSLSLFIWMGLPPAIAFSTLRIGTIGFDIGGFFRYYQQRKIDWSLFVPLTIATVLGTAIGVQFLVRMNEELLGQVVGVVLLAMIPLLIWKKDLGVESSEVTARRRWAGHMMSFLLSIWAGSFTLGIGLFNNMKQMYFYGLELITAKGTSKLPGLISVPIIVGTFAWFDLVNWSYAIVALLGALLGSYVGVKYAIRFGNKNLKWLLVVSMAFFGFKFLFGL